MNSIIKEIEAPLIKSNLPKFDVGDTVKVFVKIVEGGKERIEAGGEVVVRIGEQQLHHADATVSNRCAAAVSQKHCRWGCAPSMAA